MIQINKNIIAKKCKYVLCIGAIIGTTILTGCSLNPSKLPVESENTTSIEQVIHEEPYKVKITFTNCDESVISDELVTFYDTNGKIYNTVDLNNQNIAEDGSITIETSLTNSTNMKLVSHTLDNRIFLPEISESEKYEITIDYLSKDISVSIKQLNNSMTK